MYSFYLIKKVINSLINILVFLSLVTFTNLAYCSVPVTTDSRIKTFIYNENDVFHISVHYGYMTSIEFAKNEDIDTIAPGNGYSWKFIKDGRRLFIKSLEGAAKTNLTIITSKRTYQFELESKDASEEMDEDLVYVVRFFYPDELIGQASPKIASTMNANNFAPQPMQDIQPTQASAAVPQLSPTLASRDYNFNYSLTGPDNIAPLKAFDDGTSTFFQFPNNNALIPHIFIISETNKETRAAYSRKGEYIVVDGVYKEINLRLDNNLVKVFNEQKK